MKIYKYMGPEILTKAFSVDGFCGFKCSYPKDFNDPYELFLTIDFQQDPEMLAYYREVVGELQQRATTCFSKSPSIIPMWAHYGHNHRGVVVEIDEDVVLDYFPDIAFGDIDYADDTSEGLLNLLQRAYTIGKPRYHYLLQRGVYSAAYYTKQKCWQYELERRLVAKDEEVINEDGLILIRLPVDCVSALVVGHNATEETKTIVSSLADKIDSDYFELKIGRTTATPYFINSKMLTYEFNGSSISSCDNYCENCSEPITNETDMCSWCTIDDQHEAYAAGNNPMRILHRAGMLENYYRTMNNIGKK